MKLEVEIPDDVYKELKKLIDKGLFSSEDEAIKVAIISLVESYKMIEDGSFRNLLKNFISGDFSKILDSLPNESKDSKDDNKKEKKGFLSKFIFKK